MHTASHEFALNPPRLFVLAVHLAPVLACFVIAPYTTFVHGAFRLLSIHKSNVEATARAAGEAAAAQTAGPGEAWATATRL